MRLPRIDAAIQSCRDHLASTGAAGSEIEKFLTAYLVVITCAELEESIEQIIRVRAQKSGDPVLVSLVSSAIGIVVRSIKTSELAGVLNRFTEAHKESFQKRMEAIPQAVNSYNSIVVQRHSVAHTAAFALTFADFVKYYEEGHVVLDAFQDAVNM